MDRKILHVDQNCFFASVEMKNHPEFMNVPMAVGGGQEQRHGIILAKNQLAGACGIKTAETIWQARKKCPALVVVPAIIISIHTILEKPSKCTASTRTGLSHSGLMNAGSM